MSINKKRLIGREFKYITKNPIGRYLIDNFFNTYESLLSEVKFNTLLDAGSGEGLLLQRLSPLFNNKQKIYAIDIDPVQIAAAKKNMPRAVCKVGNIYDLPFASNSFDLVLCSEVLEHLESYELGLKELYRVTKRYCVLSVPNEPIWSILNIMRGAYLPTGNTYGHLNHWSSSAFERLVRKYFKIIKVAKPLPWTVIMCAKQK